VKVTRKARQLVRLRKAGYASVLFDLVTLIDAGRNTALRSINVIMTATYWAIGRRIAEDEQRGASRAGYGEELIDRLSRDLQSRFGRGFGRNNLALMRAFYLGRRDIFRTASGKFEGLLVSSKIRTSSGKSFGRDELAAMSQHFPLPWSHYVRLLSVRNPMAQEFYETEALRGGWTVRQLERQIDSQFYERTALSRNKVAMLRSGAKRRPEEESRHEEHLKDPYFLEFLNLKDEYSESDLEEALIAKLETFLLELGGDFTFVGRQRRLRIGSVWYRVDLLFFHRRLRCLVIIDLKLGKFTHADAGQMHLYLNYARAHWTHPEENPPVGLILCAENDTAVATYALEGLSSKVLAAEYRTALPKERTLVAEIQKTRRQLERRRP
jgi:predicted nuclease of restriction endonuclease-like (RecB) superfamily